MAPANKTLVVSDNFLAELLANPSVLKAFPALLKFKQQWLAEQQKTGCCNQSARSSTLKKLRVFILAMPGPNRDKLKKLLNLSDREIVAYEQSPEGRLRKRTL